MKKLNLAAAAVALALGAGQANATLTTGADQTQGASLFLAVWNSSISYVRDLSIHFQDVLNGTPGDINTATGPNANWVSNSGFTFSNAGDSLFASTFGGSLAGTSWTIFAQDSSSSPNLSTNPGGFVSGFSAGPTTINYQAELNAATRADNFVTLSNNNGCSTTASCTAPSSSTAYAGGSSWGTAAANALPSGNTLAAAGGSTMPFWYIRTDSAPGHTTITPTKQFEFMNSANVGMWSLGTDGTATYTLAAAVPVPGALWLFASGLLGLIGVTRRKFIV